MARWSQRAGGRPPKLPRTLDEFRELVIRRLTGHGTGFKTPRDDWPNMLNIVQTPWGVEAADVEQAAIDVGIEDPLRFASTKATAMRVVKLSIALSGAYRYAVVMNTHGVTLEDPELVERVRADTLRIEQIEGAQEALSLVIGDAEEEQFWQARIERDERYIRRLGEWERLDNLPGVEIKGRMVDLNELLRLPREEVLRRVGGAI